MLYSLKLDLNYNAPGYNIVRNIKLTERTISEFKVPECKTLEFKNSEYYISQ